MVRLLDRHQIDDEIWNATVRNSDNFRHYYLTYFLDNTVERWKALIIDDYSVIWPLPLKVKLLPTVYQPLLAQQLGPLSKSTIDQSELRDMWSFLCSRFSKVNVKFNSSCTSVPNEVARHTNIELDLSNPIDALKSGYNRNVIANLKKGEQHKLTIGTDADCLGQLLEIFKAGRGRQIKALNQKFYVDVEKITRAFEHRGESEIWSAYLNGNLVAGVVVLTSESRILNFFTAASEDAKQSGAMHSLFNAIIERYAERANVLDFEGSNNESLAFFYRSFGGLEKVYLQSDGGFVPSFLRSKL